MHALRAHPMFCLPQHAVGARHLVRHLSVSTHAAAQYFATCHPGLEEVVAAELRSPAIGAANVETGKAGVHFSGDHLTLYRSNLWLRAAIRVLQLLRELPLDPRQPSGESVYDAFRAAADWPSLLAPGKSFSVDARVWGCSNLTNSQLLNVRARDAICDAIRDKRGTKPLPPATGEVADMPLFVTAFQDTLSIYRDASGESLHRRGYRQAMHKASLNEAAAAGCLYLAGWPQLCQDGAGGALADPMAGSGTFLIEAALMATRTAPGLFRRWWPFMSWPDGEREVWREAVGEAKDARRDASGVKLWGNDVHGGALALAARDAEAAGVKSLIRLHSGDCVGWQLPAGPDLVVTNPPWGQRLLAAQREEREREDGYDRGAERRAGRGAPAREVPPELAEAWAGLGTFLKRQAGGAQAFVLSGNTQATQHLKLRADRRVPLTIGGVDCRLLQYAIHSGSMPAGAPAGKQGSRKDDQNALLW